MASASERGAWSEDVEGPKAESPAAGGVTDIEPYIDLAREIKGQVDRVVADDAARADALAEAIEAIPRRERQRVAQSIFEDLDADAQWAIVERVFGDEEIRDYLREERAARLAEVDRSSRRRALVAAFRAAGAFDTRTVPPGEQLTIGLFLESDVGVAIGRGSESDSCARMVVIRAEEPGVFRAIEDVFNPGSGYFVTADYDEETWNSERLAPHSVVRVGAIREDADEPVLDPVLYPRARVDFETPAGLSRGRLHVGYLLLGGVDLFSV